MLMFWFLFKKNSLLGVIGHNDDIENYLYALRPPTGCNKFQYEKKKNVLS